MLIKLSRFARHPQVAMHDDLGRAETIITRLLREEDQKPENKQNYHITVDCGEIEVSIPYLNDLKKLIVANGCSFSIVNLRK